MIVNTPVHNFGFMSETSFKKSLVFLQGKDFLIQVILNFFFFYSEIGTDPKTRIMERVTEMGEIFCAHYVKVKVTYLEEKIEIISKICKIQFSWLWTS